MRYLFAKYLLYGSLVWSCSCGANYHLRKAEQHIRKAEIKGAKVSADTVYKEIEVIRPEVRVDTLVKEVNFSDTIYVEKDRVVTKVKVNTVEKKVFVETICPPDTVKIEVPVVVNRDIKSGIGTMQIILYIIVALAVGYVARSVSRG